jgi:Ca2+-binding EF-hand superfamily protein
MADLTKSEFIDIMVPILSDMDEMKESSYSANDAAEAIFREATKNSNSDKITRKQFDALDETRIGLIVSFFIIDKDKSGFVDKAELTSFLKKFDDDYADQDLNDALLKEVFDSLEKNGEIKLSMDAFINFILEA